MKEESKLRFSLVLGCKNALCSFDSTRRLETMSAKIHREVQEILAMKKYCFKYLTPIIRLMHVNM